MNYFTYRLANKLYVEEVLAKILPISFIMFLLPHLAAMTQILSII